MSTTDWTELDIPDQSGRTVIVTGANSGIGYDTARALAQHGADVVLACRNRSKAETAQAAITALNPTGTVTLLDLDLSDLTAVRQSAKEFAANHTRLDLLINNAGIMAVPRALTVDGHESQFGTNHLGHFMFTAELLDLLLSTERSRVVNVSSMGHHAGRINFDDLTYEKRYSAWLAYGRTKLANLLFTYELQRRLSRVDATTIATAAHPGTSNTNLTHSVVGIMGKLMRYAEPVAGKLAQPPEMGALPTLRAAVDPTANGADYFGPDGFMEQRGHPVRVQSNKRSHDEVMARRLWDVSCELTGARWPALDATN